jgi:hypothetical protein
VRRFTPESRHCGAAEIVRYVPLADLSTPLMGDRDLTNFAWSSFYEARGTAQWG